MVVGVAVPVLAAIAFEVALGEIRCQVQLRRGEIHRKPKRPERAAMPELRPIRVLLDPFREFSTWRRTVLAVTDPSIDPATREAITRLISSIRTEQAAAALPGGPASALPGAAPEGSGERFEAPHPNQAAALPPATSAQRRPAERAAARRPAAKPAVQAGDGPEERASLVERARVADAAARERTGRPLPYREAPSVLGVRYATAREALDAARARPQPDAEAARPAASAFEETASGSGVPRARAVLDARLGEHAVPAQGSGELAGARS